MANYPVWQAIYWLAGAIPPDVARLKVITLGLDQGGPLGFKMSDALVLLGCEVKQ